VYAKAAIATVQKSVFFEDLFMTCCYNQRECTGNFREYTGSRPRGQLQILAIRDEWLPARAEGP
jgi:hypothetical protein